MRAVLTTIEVLPRQGTFEEEDSGEVLLTDSDFPPSTAAQETEVRLHY